MDKNDTLAFVQMGEAILNLADHVSGLTRVFSGRLSLLEQVASLRAKLEQKKNTPAREEAARQLSGIEIQAAAELARLQQELFDSVARAETLRDQSSALLAALRAQLEGKG